MRKAGIVAVSIVALVAAGCTSASAENSADNTEAENIVVYAGQLGPDWTQAENTPEFNGDKHPLTLAASSEAQRCFRPNPSGGATATASGDWMDNQTSGGFVYNQVVYYRNVVDADALAADFGDPAMFDCWRKLALPAFAKSASMHGKTLTDAAVGLVPVAAPAGTKAVGIRFTGNLHQPDGSVVPIREDATSLLVGRSEAFVMVGGAVDGFPESTEQLAAGLIAGRLLKADTA